jgi:hypothetical protein
MDSSISVRRRDNLAVRIDQDKRSLAVRTGRRARHPPAPQRSRTRCCTNRWRICGPRALAVIAVGARDRLTGPSSGLRVGEWPAAWSSC